MSSSTNQNYGSREVIQISLGTTSCTLSSYWMYLQGLAGTTTSPTNNNNHCYCNIDITHNSSRTSHHDHGNYYIPRALFVDQYQQQQDDYDGQRSASNMKSSSDLYQQQQEQECNWNGRPIVTLNQYGEVIIPSSAATSSNRLISNSVSYNNNTNLNIATSISSTTKIPHWDTNRYRVPTRIQNNKPMYKNVSANGRHVIWDDDDNDEEEEEPDYNEEYDDHYRRQLEQNDDDDHHHTKKSKCYNNNDNDSDNINNNNNNLDMKMMQNHSIFNNTNNDNTRMKDANTATVQEQQKQQNWQDIINLAPYNPKTNYYFVSSSFIPQLQHQKQKVNDENVALSSSLLSTATIPSSSSPRSAAVANNGITYHQALSNNTDPSFEEWKISLLEDKIRHLLEECDSCQGIVLLNDSNSLYSGLKTCILQELHDECSSAYKWNILLEDKESSSSNHPTAITTTSSTQQQNYNNTNDKNAAMTLQQRQSMIQTAVERGLALHHTSEYTNAILPLSIGNNDDIVNVALALEACTLPYRFSRAASSSSSSSSSLIGLNGPYYYGSYDGSNNFPFGSTNYFEFSEFIKSLQSQSSTRLRCIWELDTLYHHKQEVYESKYSSWWSRMCEGTTLERDQRMRQGIHQSQTILPGSWMLDSTSSGLLTSLSPNNSNSKKNNTNIDRSVHHHFALMSALRAPTNTTTATTKGMPSHLSEAQQYVSAMMQGMGIRYRPEQSVATYVPQGIGPLLGEATPASNLFRQWIQPPDNIVAPPPPVLAVLGNTTRRFPYLYETAYEFQKAVQPQAVVGSPSFISRGYYNRHVELGLLPEEDDCIAAIETCCEIRDAYESPSNDDEYHYNNHNTRVYDGDL